MKPRRVYLLPVALFALSGCSLNSTVDSSSVSSSIPSSEPTSSSSLSISSSEEPAKALDPYAEPMLGRQYYLNHIGDIFGAWQQYTGKGVTIAVIDVGFKPNHPEFTKADGTSKISDKSAAFAWNSSTDTVTRTDGVAAVYNEGESHGTFCAGVAAAAANGTGTIGIAPDAELMLLKTDCRPKSIVQAFYHAANNGAKVITISIGSYYNYGRDLGLEPYQDLKDDGSDLGTVFDAAVKACYDKGIPVISAAGNGGLDGHPTEFTFPGCVDYVIGVGGLAANSSSAIWDGSSYNPSPEWVLVDAVAPADGMYGPCHHSGLLYQGGWRGTSFASPIVAGMAALYYEAHPDHNAQDFADALKNSCIPFTPEGGTPKANQIGWGRVDVGALLGISSRAVQVRCKSSWANMNAYYWNSKTGASGPSWPGKALTKQGNVFSVDIPAGYDSMILNDGSRKSVDLHPGSFNGDVTYNLVNSITENGVYVGSYER